MDDIKDATTLAPEVCSTDPKLAADIAEKVSNLARKYVPNVKHLFTKYETYTGDADRISWEVDELLRPLVKHEIDAGWSGRDLQIILGDSMWLLVSELITRRAIEMRKDKKD